MARVELKLRDMPRLYRRGLLAVFVIAVGVRLAVVLAWGPRLGIDSQNYLAQGQEILRQGPLSFLSFAAEQSPLYSLLFALCAAVAGPHADWAIGIVQAVLGGLIALILASFTTLATRDPLAGVLTGAIAAIHVPFVFWSVYVLTDTLLLCLLALSAWLIAKLPRARWPLLVGTVTSIGLLLLVLTRRTNVLASSALLLLAAGLAASRRRALLGLAIPILVGLALLGTGILRARTGSTLGDRAEAYAWQAVYMGLQWTEQGRATEGVDIHLSTIGDDAERGAFYRDQSLSWVRADPGYFFIQADRKLKVLWAPFLPEDSTAHKLINGLYLVPLYALALLGWFVSRRNGPFLAITTTGVLVFTLVCVITFVDYDQRYRLPAELFLIPLSAVGLVRVLASINQTRGTIS